MLVESVSDSQRDYLRRCRRRDRMVVAVRWGALLFFLGLWELSARLNWIDPFLLSSPSRMALSMAASSRDSTAATFSAAVSQGISLGSWKA